MPSHSPLLPTGQAGRNLGAKAKCGCRLATLHTKPWENQFFKHSCASMMSGRRRLLSSVIIFLHWLKTLSHSELIPGTLRRLIASLLSSGNLTSCCFHHRYRFGILSTSCGSLIYRCSSSLSRCLTSSSVYRSNAVFRLLLGDSSLSEESSGRHG